MRLPIIVALLGLLVSACTKELMQESAAVESSKDTLTVTETLVELNDEQRRNIGIEVGTPETSTLSDVLKLQGEVQVPPQSVISISFPLGGYLKSTSLIVGKVVRKGEVIAEMEDLTFIELQQDYLTAKEQFQLADIEYNRQKELALGKASSDKVYQQAKSELERQRIAMESLAQKLALIGVKAQNLSANSIAKTIKITSPINGFVSKVNANIGKYTAPTEVLFELIDPSDVHLILHAYEKDINSIAIGQSVSAFTNSNPSKRWSGKVLLVGKNLDADRMALINCHFDRYDPSLVVGMFMNGEIAVSNKHALTVPEGAVVRWDNKYYVFLERANNQFEMHEVQLGTTQEGRNQLLDSSLTTTTKLVTHNAYALLMKIKNTEEE